MLVLQRFGPTILQIEWTRGVLAVSQGASGAVQFRCQMVDAAVVRAGEAVLQSDRAARKFAEADRSDEAGR